MSTLTMNDAMTGRTGLRREPGTTASVVLAVAVHVALAVVLFFGVRWQSKHPEAVVVELWDRPPVPIADPRPEIKPEPKVEVKIEPKPAPKPAPVPQKPDIAIEKAPPKKVPAIKPAPKPEPKLDLDRSKDIREQLAREMESVQRDREKQETLRQFSKPAAAPSIDAGYAARIRSKIRSNIALPPDLSGNPEAVFDVVQLPTGEILSVRLNKSSGYRTYDDAVERAILKSSPLPRPDRPEQLQRELRLTFRPLDP